MTIKDSVGQGGANRRSDVIHVQGLLNETRIGTAKLTLFVDGLVGPKTIGAILEYQKGLGKIHDGRIDPGGPTLASLEGEGSDPDKPYRPVARAIVALCAQLQRDLQSLGSPHPCAQPLQHQLEAYAVALRLLLNVDVSLTDRNSLGIFSPPTYRIANASFKGIPILGAFVVPVAAAEALVMLLMATITILALQAVAPHTGPLASKLAHELEVRRDSLARALINLWVAIRIELDSLSTLLERCKPPAANLNNGNVCQRARAEVMRSMENIVFKLDALRVIVVPKVLGGAVNLDDYRRGRQLVEEMIKHLEDAKNAFMKVFRECKCSDITPSLIL